MTKSATSVLTAAKRLAQRSEWTLSNLELQKILYLANMYYIGRTGTALVNGDFEAWDYGPVHPALYSRARVFGADPVRNIFHDIPDLDKGPAADMLDEALEALGNLGPGKLVRATHREAGAWARNYVPGRRGNVIPFADILDEYKTVNNCDKPSE